MKLLSNFYPYLKGQKLFILIPIVNALAYVLTGSIRIFGVDPGQLRGILLGSFFLWFFLLKPVHYTRSAKFILLFIIYLFVLSFLSSDPGLTFSLFFKVVLSSILFIAAYHYTKSLNIFFKINEMMILSLMIFILSALYGLLFGYGIGYSTDILLGSKGPNIAKTISTLLLIYPLVQSINFPYYSGRKKRLIQALFIVGLLIVFISMKRTSILVVLIGYLIYFLLNKSKGKTIKALIGILLFLIISSPLYFNYLESAFLFRADRAFVGEGDYTEEGRYMEYELVYKTFESGTIKHKLIGSELFNDIHFFKTERMLHMDYTSILNGAGIIGLLLFVLIPVFVIFDIKRFLAYSHIKLLPYSNVLSAVAIMLMLTSYIHSVAGSIMAIDLRSIMFYYSGAILGLLRNTDFILHFEKNTLRRIAHN